MLKFELLYLNDHLSSESQRIQQWMEPHNEKDPFHQSLVEFQDATNKLSTCLSEIQYTQKEDDSIQLYVEKSISVESPQCYCGDGALVSQNVTTMVAELNKEDFNRRLRLRTNLLILIKDKINLEFHLEYIKMQIEQNFTRDPILVLSILFDFERRGVPVRNWIFHMVSVLYSDPNPINHFFVLYQTCQTTGIGEWYPEIIQVSTVDLLDNFLGMISLFLVPFQKNGQFLLSEEDYLVLWKQFPFQHVIKSLKESPIALDYLETIFYIFQETLPRFVEMPSFCKQICQTMVRILSNFSCEKLITKTFGFLMKNNMFSFLTELNYGLVTDETVQIFLDSIKLVQNEKHIFYLIEVMIRMAQGHSLDISRAILRHFCTLILQNELFSKDILRGLSELAVSYPALITDLLEFDASHPSMLLKKISVTKWNPSEKDLEFLFNMFPTRSELALDIFSRLDYQLISTERTFQILKKLYTLYHKENMEMYIKIFSCVSWGTEGSPYTPRFEIQPFVATNEPEDPFQIYFSFCMYDIGYDTSKVIKNRLESLQNHNVLFPRLLTDLSKRGFENLPYSLYIEKYLEKDKILKEYTIGRLLSVTKNIGDATKLLTSFLLNGSKEFTIFWMKQTQMVNGWAADNRCLYILNEIIKNHKQDMFFILQLDWKDYQGHALSNSYFKGEIGSMLYHKSFRNEIVPSLDHPYVSYLFLHDLMRQEEKSRQEIYRMNRSDLYLKENCSIYRILGYCFLCHGVTDLWLKKAFWKLFMQIYCEENGPMFVNLLDKKVLMHIESLLGPNWQKDTSLSLLVEHFEPIRTTSIIKRNYFENPLEFKPLIIPQFKLTQWKITDFPFFAIHQETTQVVENLSKLSKLDARYFEILPKLFENKYMQRTLDIKCGRGPFCKQPGRVVFSVPMKIENDFVKQTLFSLRDQQRQLLEHVYKKDTSRLMLELMHTIQNDHDHWVEWFYLLIHLEVDISFVSTIIHQLLETTRVSLNQAENIKLFRFIIDKRTNTTLLKYIKPFPDWKHFFLSIHETKLYYLLKCFHKDWLDVVQDVDGLCLHVFTKILDFYSMLKKTQNAQDVKVFETYVLIFQWIQEVQLVNKNFVSFDLILQGLFTGNLPGQFLIDFIGHGEKYQFDVLEKLNLIYSLRDALKNYQKSVKTSLYVTLKPYIANLMELYHWLLQDMDWNEVFALFEPWLFPMDNRSHLEPEAQIWLLPFDTISDYEPYLTLVSHFSKYVNPETCDYLFTVYLKFSNVIKEPFITCIEKSLIPIAITPEFAHAILEKFSQGIRVAFLTQFIQKLVWPHELHSILLRCYLYCDSIFEYEKIRLSSFEEELEIFKNRQFSKKATNALNQLFLDMICDSNTLLQYLKFFLSILSDQNFAHKEIWMFLLSLKIPCTQFMQIYNYNKELSVLFNDWLKKTPDMALYYLKECTNPGVSELLIEAYFTLPDSNWEMIHSIMMEKKFMRRICIDENYILTFFAIQEYQKDEIIKLLLKWKEFEKSLILFKQYLMTEGATNVFLDHLKEISGENRGFFGSMFGASYPKNYQLCSKLLLHFLTKNPSDPIVSLALKEGKDAVAFWMSLVSQYYSNQKWLQ